MDRHPTTTTTFTTLCFDVGGSYLFFIICSITERRVDVCFQEEVDR